MATVLESGGTATAEQIRELHEVFAKFSPTLQTKTDIQGHENTELVITANELGVVSLPCPMHVTATLLYILSARHCHPPVHTTAKPRVHESSRVQTFYVWVPLLL